MLPFQPGWVLRQIAALRFCLGGGAQAPHLGPLPGLGASSVGGGIAADAAGGPAEVGGADFVSFHVLK